jgi:hypothetical protein
MQKLRQRKRLKLLLPLACISSIAIWSSTKINIDTNSYLDDKIQSANGFNSRFKP